MCPPPGNVPCIGGCRSWGGSIRDVLTKLGQLRFEALEVGHEIQRGFVAVGGILAKTFGDDPFEFSRDLRPNCRESGGLGFDDP